MKIRPVGAELFHADEERQTDMTKLTVAFRNFAKAPKKRLGKQKLMRLEMSVTCEYYVVIIVIEFKGLRLYGYEVRTKQHFSRLFQAKSKGDIFNQTSRGTSKQLIEMFSRRL
jgi:hypothetical protein